MTANEALFTGILDYAGLFPPASLSLPEALRHWAEYLQHPYGWLLGRFVLPENLADQGALLVNPPQRVSLLVNGSELPALWREVEVIESKNLPEGDPGLPVFVEVDWRQDVEMAMDRLAEKRRTGVKLRTGGLSPESIPSASAIAAFLTQAARRKLPIKFTAGLHQPVPNEDSKVGATMHGFLNVFGAAFAAYAHGAESDELEATLLNYEYKDFAVTADEFRCGGRSYSAKAIAKIRSESVVSFGSCSFEEPVDHLTRNGLL